MKLNQYHLSVLSIFTLSLLVILSCKKLHDSPKVDTAKITSADITVLYSGPQAADGCGWLIKTDIADSTFSVPDLPAQYLVNKLKLHIAYHRLATRFYCGDVPRSNDPGITEIKLDRIKTR
jgi:hypothetical protein